MVKVADTPGSSHVVASFADEGSARNAVQRLRAAGVVDTAIHVARPNQSPRPPAESPTLWRVFWSGLWWSVVGAIVGAMIGLVVGLLGLGLPGTPDNLAVHVASWAMFLHVAGALAGCYAALDTGDRFAHKADHHDTGATLVRVRSADAALLARTAEIFAMSGANDIVDTLSRSGQPSADLRR
jgi:hypothetical protein